MITAVAFHPVYTMCASASEDASIKLWDFDSGKLECTLKGHTAQINSVSFDPTGEYLVSASADLMIKLWEVNK